MKYTKLLYLAALIGFSSCSYYSRFEDPEIDLNTNMPEATITFDELKANYLGNEDYKIFDNAGHVKYALTFTGYQIPEDAQAIINAVVVSSDVEGNTYKKVVFRDLADHSALEMSIDASSLSAVYPRGQRVSLDLSGLVVGTYAESPTLGIPYFNADPKRNRHEVGRMPYLMAKGRITAYGMPDTSLITPKEMTIAQIKAAGTSIYGQVVKIKGVKFGYYVEGNQESYFETSSIKYMDNTSKEYPFSFENTLGVPISRALTDEAGNTINLSTSSYAKFAHESMPDGRWDIVAIVGWYRDQPAKTGSYQLALQSFADLTPSKQ